MQQSCHDRVIVHLEVSEDARDRQWVHDVGLTGLTNLARVLFFGDVICEADLLDIGLWPDVTQTNYKLMKIFGIFPIAR